jgi:hypothetical protein
MMLHSLRSIVNIAPCASMMRASLRISHEDGGPTGKAENQRMDEGDLHRDTA